MLQGLPGDRRSVVVVPVARPGHGQSLSQISVCWVGENCCKKEIESTANASPNVSPLFREYDLNCQTYFQDK